MKTTSLLLFAGLLLSNLIALGQKAAPVGIQLYSFRDQFAKGRSGYNGEGETDGLSGGRNRRDLRPEPD